MFKKIVLIVSLAALVCTADVFDDSVWDSIKKDDERALKTALKKGASINIQDKKKNTPLHIMVNMNNTSMVKLALKNAAKINVKNSDGNTPFLLAANNESMLKLLLENGADPLASNNLGRQISHITAVFGNTRALRYIKSYELDFNKLDKDGSSPMHLAAEKGHHLYVNELIELGANMNIRDYAGNSPLHLAALFNRTRCIDTLLDNGADVLVANKEEEFAIQLTTHDKIEEKIESAMRSQRIKVVYIMQENKMTPEEIKAKKKIELDANLKNHDSDNLDKIVDGIALDIQEDLTQDIQEEEFEEMTF